MRFIFEVGLEPFHLLNKYGGVLLFLVICSLTLFPLAFLYIVMAVSRSLLVLLAGQSESQAMETALVALQICGQATLYFSLYFPFLLGILSTHLSYRMVEQAVGRQQVLELQLDGQRSSDKEMSVEEYNALCQCLQPFTKLLEVQDMDPPNSQPVVDKQDPSKSTISTSTKTGTASYWSIPPPGVPLPLQDDNDATIASSNAEDTTINKIITETRRVIPGECNICMRHYQCGETIGWSSNQRCRHAFHAECILQWMSILGPEPSNTKPCPCCRQPFLPTMEKAAAAAAAAI